MCQFSLMDRVPTNSMNAKKFNPDNWLHLDKSNTISGKKQEKKNRVIQLFLVVVIFLQKMCLLGLFTNKMVVPCEVVKENY